MPNDALQVLLDYFAGAPLSTCALETLFCRCFLPWINSIIKKRLFISASRQPPLTVCLHTCFDQTAGLRLLGTLCEYTVDIVFALSVQSVVVTKMYSAQRQGLKGASQRFPLITDTAAASRSLICTTTVSSVSLYIHSFVLGSHK